MSDCSCTIHRSDLRRTPWEGGVWWLGVGEMRHTGHCDILSCAFDREELFYTSLDHAQMICIEIVVFCLKCLSKYSKCTILPKSDRNLGFQKVLFISDVLWKMCFWAKYRGTVHFNSTRGHKTKGTPLCFWSKSSKFMVLSKNNQHVGFKQVLFISDVLWKTCVVIYILKSL